MVNTDGHLGRTFIRSQHTLNIRDRCFSVRCPRGDSDAYTPYPTVPIALLLRKMPIDTCVHRWKFQIEPALLLRSYPYIRSIKTGLRHWRTLLRVEGRIPVWPECIDTSLEYFDSSSHLILFLILSMLLFRHQTCE